MFDISKALTIAAAAGNSHGADMLKDACIEIESLRTERDAALEENKALWRVVDAVNAVKKNGGDFKGYYFDLFVLSNALARLTPRDEKREGEDV